MRREGEEISTTQKISSQALIARAKHSIEGKRQTFSISQFIFALYVSFHHFNAIEWRAYLV
jgi:hypothetical protein